MSVTTKHIIPGFYNTFKAVPKKAFENNGVLGVVAIGLIASWGSDTEAIELLSEEIITGACLKKIGYSLEDTEEILPYVLSLTGAYKGYFYKLNKNGVKASKAIGDITFTAKYTGIVGNKISITVAKNTPASGKNTLRVLVGGAIKETFTLTSLAEFSTVESDWVDVEVASGATEITEATNSYLVGGTNGTVGTTAYDDFFNAIKYKEFNVVAIQGTDSGISDKIIAFVNNQISVKNKLIKGVVYNRPALNDYNIISVDQGVECDKFTVITELFPLLVASLRAGCPLNESLTNLSLTELIGAKKIINPINDDDNVELENAIAQGRFALRYGNDGAVRILQDINTLVNYTTDTPKGWRKNRHMAIVDYLVNEEHRLANKHMIGKYSNTEEKRNVAKATFIGIYKELYAMGAIKEYDPINDLTVLIGDDNDVMNVEQTIKPTDSIEFINVTTNVDLNM